MSGWRRCAAMALVVAAGFGELRAQMRVAGMESGVTVPLAGHVAGVAGPQSTIGDELRQMAGQAGVIFAGEVIAVRPGTASVMGAGAGWMEVEFRIDQAIRGCVGQATYVLREWSGLWAGGQQRYRPGQRLLMMLHAPSASGLSSPVGGQDGMIPLVGLGAAPKEADSFTTAAEPTVDLRWVEARLLRPSGEQLHARRLEPAKRATMGRERAVATRQGEVPALGGAEVPTQGVLRTVDSGVVADASAEVSSGQGITLRSVLAMLAAWGAEQNHAGR